MKEHMKDLMAWIEGILYFIVPIAGIAVVINNYSTTNFLMLLILIMLWGIFSFRKV